MPASKVQFTERARTILALARADAQRRGQTEATPLHLLLGLLDEGGNVALSVIENARISVDDLRQELDSKMPPKGSHRTTSGIVPLSQTADAVLDRAVIEASELGHAYVGTEHLLLALLHDRAGAPAQAFERWDFDRETARAETLRVLGRV